jgi:WD40 repeat protein
MPNAPRNRIKSIRWFKSEVALWAPLMGHDGFVSSAAFSSDGKRIVTASSVVSHAKLCNVKRVYYAA